MVITDNTIAQAAILVSAIAALVTAIKASNKSDVNAAHIDNLSTTAQTHTDQIQAMALATPTQTPTVTISTGAGQGTPQVGGGTDATN